METWLNITAFFLASVICCVKGDLWARSQADCMFTRGFSTHRSRETAEKRRVESWGFSNASDSSGSDPRPALPARRPLRKATDASGLGEPRCYGFLSTWNQFRISQPNPYAFLRALCGLRASLWFRESDGVVRLPNRSCDGEIWIRPHGQLSPHFCGYAVITFKASLREPPAVPWRIRGDPSNERAPSSFRFRDGSGVDRLDVGDCFLDRFAELTARIAVPVSQFVAVGFRMDMPPVFFQRAADFNQGDFGKQDREAVSRPRGGDGLGEGGVGQSARE